MTNLAENPSQRGSLSARGSSIKHELVPDLCEDDLIRALRAERSALTKNTYPTARMRQKQTRQIAAAFLHHIRLNRKSQRLSLDFVSLFQIELATLVAVREAAKSSQAQRITLQ